ncbi:MAG: DUF1016 N-terminal domain-containing protein [Acetobacteraceae bacterium]
MVDRLAADLRAEFPDSRGFSAANLRYMRAFAAAWPDPAILQQVVGKLPWGGCARTRLEPSGPRRPDRRRGARAAGQPSAAYRLCPRRAGGASRRRRFRCPVRTSRSLAPSRARHLSRWP